MYIIGLVLYYISSAVIKSVLKDDKKKILNEFYNENV